MPPKGSRKGSSKANEAKAKQPARGRKRKTSETMPEKLQQDQLEAAMYEDFSEAEETDPNAAIALNPPTTTTEGLPPSSQTTKAKTTKKQKKKNPNPAALEPSPASDSDQSEASDVDESPYPPLKRSKKSTVPTYLSNAEEADMMEWLKNNPAIYDRSHNDNKRRDLINGKFDEKAASFGRPEITGAALRTWYETQRTKMGKLDRKNKKSGSGAPVMTGRQRWVWDNFQFLRGHMYHHSKRRPIKSIRRQRLADLAEEDPINPTPSPVEAEEGRGGEPGAGATDTDAANSQAPPVASTSQQRPPFSRQQSVSGAPRTGRTQAPVDPSEALTSPDLALMQVSQRLMSLLLPQLRRNDSAVAFSEVVADKLSALPPALFQDCCNRIWEVMREFEVFARQQGPAGEAQRSEPEPTPGISSTQSSRFTPPAPRPQPRVVTCEMPRTPVSTHSRVQQCRTPLYQPPPEYWGLAQQPISSAGTFAVYNSQDGELIQRAFPDLYTNHGSNRPSSCPPTTQLQATPNRPPSMGSVDYAPLNTPRAVTISPSTFLNPPASQERTYQNLGVAAGATPPAQQTSDVDEGKKDSQEDGELGYVVTSDMVLQDSSKEQ